MINNIKDGDWYISTSIGLTPFGKLSSGGLDFFKKEKNSYVPNEIHVNEELKIVVVKWDDGTETKVTCDNDDKFNIDTGFAQALKYKLFGGKTEFKEKWSKIIYRRVRKH